MFSQDSFTFTFAPNPCLLVINDEITIGVIAEDVLKEIVSKTIHVHKPANNKFEMICDIFATQRRYNKHKKANL